MFLGKNLANLPILGSKLRTIAQILQKGRFLHKYAENSRRMKKNSRGFVK